MKKRLLAGVLSLALTFSALFSLSGCSTAVQASDMMSGIKAGETIADADLTGENSLAIAEFAVSLFKNGSYSGENVLISPLSVLCALAMTANGAKGETLTQMEEAFSLSVPELNNYLHTYINSLPAGDKYKVNAANSIWLKDDGSITVEQSFLQTNADYYGASIYKAPFNGETLKDINSWVRDNTDGMIEGVLDSIPGEAVMYLINALAFDAEWENIYKETQLWDGIFTTQSGEEKDAKMMDSCEYAYLEDAGATGFLKYYADRKYAFAALLPNEDSSIDEYISSLTGSSLMDTLKNVQDTKVMASIPKFEAEYSAEMSEILNSMSMKDAFNPDRADFSALGRSENGGIYISKILHKTRIAVDERGTKAGAVTAVEMGTTAMPPEEPKTVSLDRPFVYMLIDCETNLPLFIGTMMDIA